MKDIKILAILIGVVTDVFSTEVMVTKYVMLISIIYGVRGGQHIHEFLLHPSPLIHAQEMALGVYGSFLGGFITARMAKTAEIKNALLMGLLSDMTAAALFRSIDPWELIAGSILTPTAAMLGGYLSQVIAKENSR